MENTVKKAFSSSELEITINLLNMFAEKYLSMEDETSNKMMLEVTTGWNTKSVIIA